MKKKIIIGVSILAVAIIGVILYEVLIASKKSPAKTASITNGDLSIHVTYCAPYKKGRLIFGEEKDGALQPYGQYWRLGANAATEITFSKNVNFGGKPVNAGKYRMYAVPGAQAWKVALNSEVGSWGAAEPDHANDIVVVEVPASSPPSEVEQFVINFTNDSTAVQMDFAWANAQVRVPITGQ